MSDRVQCLIFIKSGVGTALEGYTLVNPLLRKVAPDSGLGLFNSTAPYATLEQVNPPQNTKFDMIEVWQNLSIFTKSDVSQQPRIYVSEYNLEQVRRLFPAGSNVHFITRFRINEKSSGHQRNTALGYDNLRIIEKLLMSGADIKWRCPEGGTTLADFAAEKGSASLIALLRQCESNLDARQNESIMPLHTAVKKNDLEMVKALLENGVDINGRMADGSSALHLATKAGLPEMVQLLVVKGAHIDAKTAKGWTALHLAAHAGSTGTALLLLQHGADLESRINAGVHEGATALHIAIKEERWGVARQFVENGASLSAQCRKGYNALCFTVATGDTYFMEYLISRGLDFTSPGNRKAFCLAFQREYTFVVKKMMELGFSVDAAVVAEPDVLFGAVHKNFFRIVERLLEAGADVHQEHLFLGTKMTPIHVACRYADPKMVQILLDYGADPGALRGVGNFNTPMADAVEAGNKETVQLLLGKNMSVRGRPEFLRSAIEDRHYGLMELLLENGAAVDSKEYYDDELPISIAVRKGYKEAAVILMKYGASFSFKDFEKVNYPWQEYASPDFFKEFLIYGFTTDLDMASSIHLHEILDKCDLDVDFNDVDFYFRRDMKERAKIVAQFVVKMDVASMKVAGGAHSVVPARFFKALDLGRFRTECKKELDRMKARTILDTGVTLFDVLTKTSNRVARFTRNEGIRKELQPEFEEKYSHYGSILRCQFERGNMRRVLLDKGISALCSLNRWFHALPFELKEDIACFLNNQDLFILMQCCQIDEKSMFSFKAFPPNFSYREFVWN